ncbi:hypothetical protein [Micromonospora sp. NPDC000668]|uniref:hypothetical protein n=1 Tax=Micromonospora sp. NPDC000668 TaxID=3364219 RepID=UPI0036B41DD4
MSLIQACVTATTTMLAVLIGGWLTVRAQDRLWRRDQDRHWRDIRLNAYTDFIGAVREYVAFVLNPAARIIAVPRPRDPGDLMPFFDDEGSRYRERLESTKTALRLLAGRSEVVSGSSELMRQPGSWRPCGRIAASRRCRPTGSTRCGRPSADSSRRPGPNSACPPRLRHNRSTKAPPFGAGALVARWRFARRAAGTGAWNGGWQHRGPR